MVSRTLTERGDLIEAASSMPAGSTQQLTVLAASGSLSFIQLRALTRSMDPELVIVGKLGALLAIDRVVLSQGVVDEYESLVHLAHDASAVYVSDGGSSRVLYSAKDLVQDALSVGAGLAAGGGGAAVSVGAIIRRFLRTAAKSVGDHLVEDFIDKQFNATSSAAPSQLRLISSRLDASAAWAQESGPSPAVQFARRVTPGQLGPMIRSEALLAAIKRAGENELLMDEVLPPFVARTAVLIDPSASKDAPLGFSSLADVCDGVLNVFTSGEAGFRYGTFQGPASQAQCSLSYPGLATISMGIDDPDILKLVERFVQAAVKAKTLDPITSSLGAAAFRLGAILYYDLAHQTLNGDDIARGIAETFFPPFSVSPLGVSTLNPVVTLSHDALAFGLANVGGVIARNPVPDNPSRLSISRAGEALSALGLTADALNEGTPDDPETRREAVLLGLSQIDSALQDAAPMSLRYLGKDAESISRVVKYLAPAFDFSAEPAAPHHLDDGSDDA